jgi:sugar phosphate isomerase/epimerase
MRLGFSLSPNLILGKPQQTNSAELLAYYGGASGFLHELKEQGITSIEIRYMIREMEEEAGERIVHQIWDAGLEITVHGHVDGEFAGAEFGDVYPPLKPMLRAYDKHQKEIVMPIHAFAAPSGDRGELGRRTVALFREWSSIVVAGKLPVIFAIELNRAKASSIDPGDTCEGVIEMVDAVQSPNAGITWDMGHYYSNMLVEARAAGDLTTEWAYEQLPPPSFIERTVHTHIHGLGEKGTHCPLSERQSLPLESYVKALKNRGYRGVYNLELDFSRFPENDSLSKHVFSSIERLRNCVADTETAAI